MVTEYQAFRFIRNYRSMTLDEVAEFVGVAKSSISQYERGKMNLTQEHRAKLLRFYSIDSQRLNALRVIIFNLELYLNGEDEEDEDKAAGGR